MSAWLVDPCIVQDNTIPFETREIFSDGLGGSGFHAGLTGPRGVGGSDAG